MQAVEKITVSVKPLQHRGGKQLGLYFPFDKELGAIAKSMGCRWSQTHKCWYLPNNPANLKKIFAEFKKEAWIDASALPFKSKEEPLAEKKQNSKPKAQKGANKPFLKHILTC